MVPCNTTHSIFVEDFCCKIVGLGKRLGGGTLEAVPALRCERLFSSQSKLGSPEVPLFVAHTDFWRSDFCFWCLGLGLYIFCLFCSEVHLKSFLVSSPW